MSWLELSLTLHASQQEGVETALEDLGALSITLADADADTPDERAIFEPGVGETPLWNDVVLQALFSADVDRAGVADVADLPVDGNVCTADLCINDVPSNPALLPTSPERKIAEQAGWQIPADGTEITL